MRVCVGLLFVVFLIPLSGCGSSRDVAWHWDRVDEYNEYLRNSGNRKSDAQGYSYVDDAPDIMPSLCVLEREGEIEHIDLVFPNVPKTEEVAKFWLQFVNGTPSIVYATANPSCPEFTTEGIELFHTNLWFKPSAKAKVKELIGKIEQFGGDKGNFPAPE